MKNLKNIFVAIDFSPSSDEALRQAHERAITAGARLTVCHIIPNELRSDLLFPQISQHEALKVPVDVEQAADSISKRVMKITGATGAAIGIVADHGTPYAEIIKRAEESDAGLIVLGSHGMTSASGVLLGSVTKKVIRYAHSPVLVARKPKALGRIIAGTDFSDPSLLAIEAALDEARRTQAQLTVAHSLELHLTMRSAAVFEGGSPVLSDEAYDDIQKHAHNRLAAVLKKFNATGDVRVLRGAAAPALVSLAEDLEAELLVVGTVGRTGLKRLLLGSVAEAVASEAPCSVLIVRSHSD